MKRCYVSKNFRKATLSIIYQADEIIEEYQAEGLDLTLRQLYYQFVSRDLLPNSQKSYDRLGDIISDGRMAGMLDWSAIVDRTRTVHTHSSWENPAEIVTACAKQFRLDWWEGQDYRPEVWIEKEALLGVIAGPCRRFRVPYFACKGYSSQSAQWRAGRRFLETQRAGQTPVIIHLGDHDPSGIDMTRDIEDRINIFLDRDGGEPLLVKRIALTWDQVQQYNPPPNPTKMSDSRAKVYVPKYGYESWELDALNPKTLDRLVTDTVESFRDDDVYEEVLEREKAHRELLAAVGEELEG